MSLKISIFYLFCLIVINVPYTSPATCGGICIESTYCIYYELACLIPPANKIELCLDRWMLCDTEPMDPGRRCPYIPDRGNSVRWYFNAETRQCTQFLYAGCDGNANNFNSSEECQAACGMVQCYEPLNIGTSFCNYGHTNVQGTYYAYHWILKDCLPFYYFGCNGNYNRFPTKDECLNTCRGNSTG